MGTAQSYLKDTQENEGTYKGKRTCLQSPGIYLATKSPRIYGATHGLLHFIVGSIPFSGVRCSADSLQ